MNLKPGVSGFSRNFLGMVTKGLRSFRFVLAVSLVPSSSSSISFTRRQTEDDDDHEHDQEFPRLNRPQFLHRQQTEDEDEHDFRRG